MNMGLGKVGASDTCFKRKYRFLFRINDISGDTSDGVNALPPLKSARPSLSFKEMEAQHLNETIFYPSKPEWKPVNLVLYDIKGSTNPVWKWITKAYDPSLDNGGWKPSVSSGFKIGRCSLEMYDGCGSVIEKWVFEGAWCQNIDFGDLDMSSSEVSTIDLTLRYDRAYIQ
jgi:hypothetical protein